MTAVDDLLRGYVAEYREAGDADPRPYLAQVSGLDRAELAARIDRFLDRAPPPAYDPAAFAAFRADPARQALVEQVLDDATLTELRAEAALTKAEVGRRLAERLGLTGREGRVKARYHDIEVGNVDPTRVRPAVWSALAEALGASADRLRGAAERAFGGAFEGEAHSFARSAEGRASPPVSPVPLKPADDDVDRALFDD
jgi:hypothetical protein